MRIRFTGGRIPVRKSCCAAEQAPVSATENTGARHVARMSRGATTAKWLSKSLPLPPALTSVKSRSFMAGAHVMAPFGAGMAFERASA